MKKPAAYVFAIVLAWVSMACGQQGEVADTVYTNDNADVILHNGIIYTVNEAQPYAEAVAIKDGRFVGVGSESEMNAYLGDDTEVIDLQEHFVVPGLVDAHTHGVDSHHPLLFTLTLDSTDQKSLLRSVKKYAEENPDKEWIIGGIWATGMFPGDNPQRSLLDEVVLDRPVFLRDQSGHSVWLNSKAIEIAGLDDPNIELDPRAIVERDEAGMATGTIREFAMGHVRRFMPATPIREWEESARQMQVTYHRYGITATRLAGERLDYVKSVIALENKGELNMHLGMALVYDHYDSPLSLEDQIKEIEQADQYVSELVDPRAIKIFIDGTQLASQAWNVKPYPDDPENFGTTYYTPEALTEFVDKATGMNRSVMAHACGSRSVREMLNAIEAAKRNHPNSTVRHQPTHNIQIEPEDMGRFKELDLAAEISPLMIMNPGLVEAISSQVGRDTLENGMWRARDLIDAGNTLALATDFNVAPLNPWNIMEYVVTRENDQFPELGRIAPSSAITVAEAIRAYTYGGAYAIGKEDKFGTIEPGKSADLVVLDRNPLDLEQKGQSNRINETKVLYTVFQGKVVYENVEEMMPGRNTDWTP